MVIKLNICNNPNSTESPGFRRNLRYYFSEYSGSTSIHGLKFLGETKRTWIERIFWLIFLSTSLYFCIVLIMQIYNKWVNFPVIVNFATSKTPIWEIPFPAVTICPEIKSQRNIYNFTDKLLKRTEEFNDTEEIKFKYMSLVCPTGAEELASVNYSSSVYEVTNKSAVDFLREVAPNFEETLSHAQWLKQDLLRSGEEFIKIFSPILTNEGICYSFNLLDPNDIFKDIVTNYEGFHLIDQNPSLWTVEKGYDDNAELTAFPRRTVLSGVKGGLDLMLLTTAEDIDPLCSDAVQGYKVILSQPGEMPNGNQQYFRVPLNQDITAAVKPNMMTTSNDLQHYEYEARQCYFPGEKKLHFFKIYNQENCLLECLTNFTEYYCGCVAFYMPHDNSTSICASVMYDCLSDAEAYFLSDEVTSKIRHSKRLKEKNKNDYEDSEECNCLPSCNSLTFDIETTQSDWDWRPVFTVWNISELSDVMHYSRLRIFFKDMQFITSERNQLYGQTDFWANCGGLLGLFTGFSFISIIEILYFMTLRLACNIRKFGRGYWSGAAELLEAKQ